MNVTVNIVCYKSKTLSNGEYPLMIRVCKDGKKKYKSLGVSVNPKFWNFEKNSLKPNCPNYEYLSKIIADKASELSEESEVFSHWSCTFIDGVAVPYQSPGTLKHRYIVSTEFTLVAVIYQNCGYIASCTTNWDW